MPLKKVLVSERGSLFIYITYVEVQRLLFLSTSVLRSRVGFQSVLFCTLYFLRRRLFQESSGPFFKWRASRLDSYGGVEAVLKFEEDETKGLLPPLFPNILLLLPDLLSSQTPPSPLFCLLCTVIRPLAAKGRKHGGRAKEGEILVRPI